MPWDYEPPTSSSPPRTPAPRPPQRAPAADGLSHALATRVLQREPLPEAEITPAPKEPAPEKPAPEKPAPEKAPPWSFDPRRPADRRRAVDLRLPHHPRLPPPDLSTPGPFAPGRRIPDVTRPSRAWLEEALRRDELLRKLPNAVRTKAIDALKDADEKAADAIIDALPWGAEGKQAAKAALKSILQLAKGKTYKPPPEAHNPAFDFIKPVPFPKVKGEVIVPILTRRF